MKYCVDYYKNLKNKEKADEYTINYTKKNDILIDFLEENKDKRINLTIEEKLTDGELRLLKSICDSYSNLVLRFEDYDYDYVENITESGVPFFYGNRVNNWDEFTGLIDLAVTDVYIVEEFAFELDKISKIAHDEGVRIRIYPNVAQSRWKDTPDIKKFWVRPEDIDFYSQYADVCEFFGTIEQVPVFLKIYKEDKQWFGLLNEIIIGLKSPLDSRFIIPRFAERRIKCGKNCLKNGNCQMCETVVSLSKTLKEANIMVTMKKED
jgi:hypothetical protein